MILSLLANALPFPTDAIACTPTVLPTPSPYYTYKFNGVTYQRNTAEALRIIRADAKAWWANDTRAKVHNSMRHAVEMWRQVLNTNGYVIIGRYDVTVYYVTSAGNAARSSGLDQCKTRRLCEILGVPFVDLRTPGPNNGDIMRVIFATDCDPVRDPPPADTSRGYAVTYSGYHRPDVTRYLMGYARIGAEVVFPGTWIDQLYP